jgi:hypothetical protein
MKNIANNGIALANSFFGDLKDKGEITLPSVLKRPGRWMASYDDSTLGIFYIDRNELKRVSEYHNNGWPPFPGFLISDKNRSSDTPVAVTISGTCNIFSSNRTSNMFAFCVKPGATFTVVDHFQEIKDVSGQEFKYKVDLAFIIGIAQEEPWESIKRRLVELLEHSLEVWRNIV